MKKTFSSGCAQYLGHQQSVSSHRERPECQCNGFSSNVLSLRLWGDCSSRPALEKADSTRCPGTAVGKLDVPVQLLWCSWSTCNWCECIRKIKATALSHVPPLSLSSLYLHLAEAASVVNFRVSVVYFEKDVKLALCHAAGWICDKKDQEKTGMNPGTFQRAVWSWVLWLLGKRCSKSPCSG